MNAVLPKNLPGLVNKTNEPSAVAPARTPKLSLISVNAFLIPPIKSNSPSGPINPSNILPRVSFNCVNFSTM